MGYQDLVGEIIAAEHSAQEIARETREREGIQEASLRTEAAAIRKEAMDRTQAKVEEVRRQINAEAEADLVRWDQRLADAMAKVESANRKYRRNWVDTLFDMIVKEEP